MIIFINGSFGIGKTTAAQLLTQRLDKALLYDAEEVGAMLRNIVGPIDWSGDFQDYPLWRSLTVEVALRLIDSYQRDLVMPMTIWRQGYFNEVMSGLKAGGQTVHHFCLTAPHDTIIKRIAERGEQGPGDWVYDQVPKCITAFTADCFEEKIDTSNLSAAAVADYIYSRISTNEQ